MILPSFCGLFTQFLLFVYLVFVGFDPVFVGFSLGFCWFFMGFLVFAWFLCYNKKCLQYEIETIFYYFLLSLFLGVYCYGF